MQGTVSLNRQVDVLDLPRSQIPCTLDCTMTIFSDMKSLSRLSIEAAAIVCAGCAAVAKPVKTSDGKKGFKVTRDGSANDCFTCGEAATDSCVGKDAVVDRNESSLPSNYGVLVRRHVVAERK